MGETSDADRIAWLLARLEELYDVLWLTGPVRHPVDATEQVRIMRNDLAIADRRARRWEAAARRWHRDMVVMSNAIKRIGIERDTARRELGEVRRIVEEHRKAAQDAATEGWNSYNDGREDALNVLSDALAADLKGTP